MILYQCKSLALTGGKTAQRCDHCTSRLAVGFRQRQPARSGELLPCLVQSRVIDHLIKATGILYHQSLSLQSPLWPPRETAHSIVRCVLGVKASGIWPLQARFPPRRFCARPWSVAATAGRADGDARRAEGACGHDCGGGRRNAHRCVAIQERRPCACAPVARLRRVIASVCPKSAGRRCHNAHPAARRRRPFRRRPVQRPSLAGCYNMRRLTGTRSWPPASRELFGGGWRIKHARDSLR
jgi:hypothetical protein